MASCPVHITAAAALAAVLLSGCSRDTAQSQGPRQAAPKPRPAWGCVYVSDSGLEWVAPGQAAAPSALVAVPGGADRVQAALSPNRRTVAMAIASDRVVLVDPLAGSVRELARLSPGVDYWEGDLQWSPDGKRVAYTDAGDVYVVGLTGDAPMHLTQTGDVTCLTWKPDGSAIAYGRRDRTDQDLGLWCTASSGGEPVQLAKRSGDVFGVTWPRWSPDGRRIAFLRAYEGGSLCLANADASAPTLDIAEAWHPLVWLPDSSGVVFNSSPYPGPSNGLMLYRPGQAPRLVLGGDLHDFDLREGSQALAVVGEGGDERTEQAPSEVRVVLVTDVAGAGLRARTITRLTETCYGLVAWRPDGRGYALVAIPLGGPPGTLQLGDLDGKLRVAAQKARSIVGWAEVPGAGGREPRSEGGQAPAGNSR